tara:strand:+ start:1511 stop:1708 length:198 start_codon:yes stop_codon:yes gene_type:complete
MTDEHPRIELELWTGFSLIEIADYINEQIETTDIINFVKYLGELQACDEFISPIAKHFQELLDFE